MCRICVCLVFCMIVKLGSPLSLFQTVFCKLQRSCRSEEKCTVVHGGSVFVMAVHAPDAGKVLEEREVHQRDDTHVA